MWWGWCLPWRVVVSTEWSWWCRVLWVVVSTEWLAGCRVLRVVCRERGGDAGAERGGVTVGDGSGS